MRFLIMLLGSIEAGGTKFVCAVGDENFNEIDKKIIPTTTPEETLEASIEFFKQYPELTALSIASFGPIDTNPASEKYGYITDTPKVKWQNCNFVGTMTDALNIPVYWTTDVNGSVYGEYVNLKDKYDNPALVYYTLGTGVGAGAIQDGRFIGGISTPEMGHVRLQRHPADLNFTGICPYHHDCLEGLVAGPTFKARLGISGEDVPDNHPVWDIMAYYVAQAAVQVTAILRPQKIIFGGSVSRPAFLERVRKQFAMLWNDYLPVGSLDEYIVNPSVPENGSATLGNFALAKHLIETNK